jgi:hypothetical protein
MPTPLAPPALEVVLQGLHDSEIRCGIRNDPPAGGITAWIDYGDRTERATFYGTIVGDRQVWPAADRIAARRYHTSSRAMSILWKLERDQDQARNLSLECHFPGKPRKRHVAILSPASRRFVLWGDSAGPRPTRKN